MYAEGRYECKILAQRLEETKQKKPALVLQIQPMTYTECDPPRDVSEGSTQSMYFYITPKTVDFVIPQLESLGWKGTSLSSLDPMQAGFHDFSGWTFFANCKHEEDQNGRINARWLMAGKPKPRPTKEAINEADKLFNDAVRNRGKVKQSALVDDGIPF